MRFSAIALVSVVFSGLAGAAFAQVPQIYGRDGQYLGNLSSNPYDPNSVTNPYGRYGNPYSPDSINNQYGKYGNPYSPYSATNPYATQPPILVAPSTP